MARKIRQKQATYIREQKKISFEKTLNLENIRPKTENQKKIFSYYYQNKNLLVHGLPGTGFFKFVSGFERPIAI
jgi:DNA replication protein DnaC